MMSNFDKFIALCLIFNTGASIYDANIISFLGWFVAFCYFTEVVIKKKELGEKK